ncbi:MAG: cell envelope integrity EipB family protein [Hyphomicrobium sp.]
MRTLQSALCAAAALLAFPALASDVAFSPHRAVYDITLARAAPGSGVAGLTGRMVFELNGSACEGFTQNMRFVTRMTNQEGTETVNDLRASSFEEAAGKRLRFSSTQYQNEDVVESSQGDATRGADAESVKVDLKKPAKKKFDLPKDIYFPIQHAAALITSAREGRQLFTANLYDGSEKGDKYYLTTSVIGNKTERGAVKSSAAFTGSDRLAQFDSWPVAISYFDPNKDKQDSTPAYELAFRYYENGVTANLSIDYGEFAISGALKELTFLDAATCASGAH